MSLYLEREMKIYNFGWSVCEGERPSPPSSWDSPIVEVSRKHFL